MRIKARIFFDLFFRIVFLNYSLRNAFFVIELILGFAMLIAFKKIIHKYNVYLITIGKLSKLSYILNRNFRSFLSLIDIQKLIAVFIIATII